MRTGLAVDARGWQDVLDMLTKGGGANGSDQPETPHLMSSLEVTRAGPRLLGNYLMTSIPRRGLAGGTEGKQARRSSRSSPFSDKSPISSRRP